MTIQGFTLYVVLFSYILLFQKVFVPVYLSFFYFDFVFLAAREFFFFLPYSLYYYHAYKSLSGMCVVVYIKY